MPKNTSNSSPNILILLAGGSSNRSKPVDKLFYEILPGYTTFQQSLHIFLKTNIFDLVIIVHNSYNKTLIQEAVHKLNCKNVIYVPGGNSRFESVKNAIDFIDSEYDNSLVCVHNAANPYVTADDILGSINMAKQCSNVVCALKATSTYKIIDETKIVQHIPKDLLYEAQTPQISSVGTLKYAFKKAENENKEFSDEGELLDYAGYDVFLYECDPNNKKITFTHDLQYKYIYGYGQDTHLFAQAFNVKKPLILGGFTLPEELTIDADSDGDVVIHSLINAIQSAFSEKPLGSFANSMRADGITNSIEYLRKAMGNIVNHSCQIEKIIIHIEALKPQIDPYHHNIVNRLSELLSVPNETIALTYESGDGATEFGKGKGIRAITTILFKRLHV